MGSKIITVILGILLVVGLLACLYYKVHDYATFVMTVFIFAEVFGDNTTNQTDGNDTN